jgi:tellurite resistance protein
VTPPPSLQPLIDEVLTHFAHGDAGLGTIVDLAVLVAMADGKIDAVEMAALTESVEAIVGSRLVISMVKHLVTQSRADIRGKGIEAAAQSIGAILAKQGAAEDGLLLGLAVAFASEGLAVAEREVLEGVSRAAGVSPERFAELVEAVRPGEG